MGLGHLFPWRSLEEAAAWILEPSGLSLDALSAKNPWGVFYAQRFRPREYEAFKGFPTPSRKVELYSEQLAKEGVEPLPTPVDVEELQPSRDYPLLLISGVRHPFYTHSQFRWIEAFKSRAPGPVAELHPEALREAGVEEGGEVRVTTKYGSAVFRARASSKLRRDVVSVSHGWPGVNKLFSYEPVDPATGYPAFKAVPCRVEPA